MAEYWKITQAWESAMADVDKIMADVDKIMADVDKIMADVDKIMADVGIWRPMLTEEIKVKSSDICLDYLRA
jgi:hypothetical protein